MGGANLRRTESDGSQSAEAAADGMRFSEINP
jgi:hypothetical protein